MKLEQIHSPFSIASFLSDEHDKKNVITENQSPHSEASSCPSLESSATSESDQVVEEFFRTAPGVITSVATPTPKVEQVVRPEMTKIRRFECRFCSFAFQRKHDWKRHESNHRNIKTVYCKDCGKGFLRKDGLRKHEQMDPRIKRFRCVRKT